MSLADLQNMFLNPDLLERYGPRFIDGLLVTGKLVAISFGTSNGSQLCPTAHLAVANPIPTPTRAGYTQNVTSSHSHTGSASSKASATNAQSTQQAQTPRPAPGTPACAA